MANNVGMTVEEYKKLKEGLLQVFVNNVNWDSGREAYQQTSGMAAAQAATALIQLERDIAPKLSLE